MEDELSRENPTPASDGYDDDVTSQNPARDKVEADSTYQPDAQGSEDRSGQEDQEGSSQAGHQTDQTDNDPTDAALRAVRQYIPETYNQQTEGNDDQADDRIGDEQFTTAYDIIEHMEQLIEDAKTSIFNTDVVKISKSEFLSLLHDLKKGLPVQLERASALMREAERRLENAQTQSNSIVSDAHSRAEGIVREANEQAQFLAGQENVVSIATEKARDILDRAQEKANQLTRGANDYASKSMRDLDEQITEVHKSIQSGLQVLHQRQEDREQDIPRLSAEDYPDHH